MNKKKEVELYIYKFEDNFPIFLSRKDLIEDWKKNPKKEIFFLAKDNFWTKELPTSASSLFLSDFYPPENATVIDLLQEKGYLLLGKAILDEFACGGTGLFSSYGKVVNPHNQMHIAGGSSSGSAIAVASKLVPFALGHDTGDSIRRPASYCGVIGFKPSYGLVSRYGVIPMASSLDTVGIIASDLKVASEIFRVIKKTDYRDLITIAAKKRMIRIRKRNKIAVITGIENFLSNEYRSLYLQIINKLKLMSYCIEEVEIKEELRENLQITYLVICSSELTSHLNSLQGITYGRWQESPNLYSIEKKRSKFLGKWVKERILLGSYFLSNASIIEQAQRLRMAYKEWTEKIFEKYDFLIFPGTHGSAPLTSSFEEETGIQKSSWIDNLLLLGNLTGNPSLNIPIGMENKMPVSLNIDGPWGNDEKLLKFASKLLR